jgi:RNA polymerase sigma-70 factor (ECF subfamily)
MPSLSCAYDHFPVLAPDSAGAALPAGEDRPAFAEFADVVRGNQARILRLATGMLRDGDLAEDVAQETFVRAFRFYTSFRSESALSTWLYRIAVNLCIDAQRKQARTERLADDDERAERPDPSPAPDRTLETRELARHAEAALERLSPDHKAILLLREVEGLSYAEIARVLRIPKGTVMSRLFHARSNLQRAAHALAG